MSSWLSALLALSQVPYKFLALVMLFTNIIIASTVNSN